MSPGEGKAPYQFDPIALGRGFRFKSNGGFSSSTLFLFIMRVRTIIATALSLQFKLSHSGDIYLNFL